MIEKYIDEGLHPLQYDDTASYQYQMICVSKTDTELSLMHFIIFPENIALKKPAYQSSTDDDDVTRNAAGSAVDGNLANNWECGDPCSNTATDPEAWWAVDLQSTYTLDYVTLTNRNHEFGKAQIGMHVVAHINPIYKQEIQIDFLKAQPQHVHIIRSVLQRCS